MDTQTYLQDQEAIWQEVDRHRPTQRAPFSVECMEKWSTKSTLAAVGFFCATIGLTSLGALSSHLPLTTAGLCFLPFAVLFEAVSLKMAMLVGKTGRGIELTQDQEETMAAYAVRYPKLLDTMLYWVASNENNQLTSREWEAVRRVIKNRSRVCDNLMGMGMWELDDHVKNKTIDESALKEVQEKFQAYRNALILDKKTSLSPATPSSGRRI